MVEQIQGGAVSSDVDVEDISELEGIQNQRKEFEENQRSGSQGGGQAPGKQGNGNTPLPGQTGKPAPTAEADPLKDLQTQFGQANQTITELKAQLGRLQAYQHKVDRLEQQFRQKPAAPQSDNPEEAAVLAAQKKYIADMMQEEYGLTPELARSLTQDAQSRQAERSVMDFSSQVERMGGKEFKKLEPFATQLVNEHWDKAIAGDPVSRDILQTPGNLLWHAQQLFAESAEAQHQEIADTRTRAVEKPTLKPGGTPAPSKGRFRDEELGDLDLEDLPALTKQIDEMEKATRRR